MATDLYGQMEMFRELLSEREALVRLRKIDKQERTALLIQLYNDYVRICMVGKSIWYGKDASKRGDYKVTIK